MENKVKLTLIENPHFQHSIYKIDGTPYVFGDYSIKEIDKWKTFELRSDDIFVTSFPKSGTTLVNEIVTAIVNDCDFEKISSVPYKKRAQYFEFPEPGIEFINQMKEQRIIKTHVPLNLLPENIAKISKVIYSIRNPKDVMVSYLHFMRELKDVCYSGSFDNLVDETIENRIPYGPLPTHVEEYLNTPSVLIVFYEDLITDKFNQIKRISEFLGKQIDDENIRKIMDWSTFNSMRSNKKIQEYFNEDVTNLDTFFRKGEIGDWINYFTEETSSKFDRYIKENFNPNLKFNYGFTDEEIKAYYSNKNAKKITCD